MKATVILFLLVNLLGRGLAAETNAVTDGSSENSHYVGKDSLSYALGVDLARNFKRQQVEVDPNQFAQGLRDGFSGEKVAMTEVEISACLNYLQTHIRQRQAMTRGLKSADINKKQALEFLSVNRQKQGVVTLPSGVQYEVLAAGSSRNPDATNAVECAYRLTLVDGVQVAGTAEGKSDTFPVQDAPIAAWREILPKMTIGSKWRVYVPPALAYGINGIPGKVGANELIISDLELIQVK